MQCLNEKCVAFKKCFKPERRMWPGEAHKIICVHPDRRMELKRAQDGGYPVTWLDMANLNEEIRLEQDDTQW